MAASHEYRTIDDKLIALSIFSEENNLPQTAGRPIKGLTVISSIVGEIGAKQDPPLTITENSLYRKLITKSAIMAEDLTIPENADQSTKLLYTEVGHLYKAKGSFIPSTEEAATVAINVIFAPEGQFHVSKKGREGLVKDVIDIEISDINLLHKPGNSKDTKKKKNANKNLAKTLISELAGWNNFEDSAIVIRHIAASEGIKTEELIKSLSNENILATGEAAAILLGLAAGALSIYSFITLNPATAVAAGFLFETALAGVDVKLYDGSRRNEVRVRRGETGAIHKQLFDSNLQNMMNAAQFDSKKIIPSGDGTTTYGELLSLIVKIYEKNYSEAVLNRNTKIASELTQRVHRDITILLLAANPEANLIAVQKAERQMAVELLGGGKLIFEKGKGKPTPTAQKLIDGYNTTNYK